MVNRRGRTNCGAGALLALWLALSPPNALAVLVIEGSGEFQDRLREALAVLARSDDHRIRALHAAAEGAPATIRFRRMTDDPSTWSSNADPERGHTEPGDGRPKREGRSRPTEAIVHLPISAVEPGSTRWKSGLLVHELVHALDLATGRYHADYTIRERRAVFMQNIWRSHTSYRLRSSYHGRFATLDHQQAARDGTVETWVAWVFERSDIPPFASTRTP